MSKKNPIQHFIELNIQTKYEQLLKVDILHDFFNDGLAKNLEILPDNQTKLRLKQYQLKSAQEGSGLTIGYGQSLTTGSPLNDLNSPLKLTFWIKINDPNFLNYTNIPFEFGDYVYHFTNRSNDKIDDEHANLSSDEFVRETDRLPLSGAILDYRFSEPMEDVTVEVANELGEIVFERKYRGEVSVCTINLAEEPAGKYTLMIDGLEEFSFYVSPEGVRGVFGVIDIYIDPNDKTAFSLFENGKPVVKKMFNIHFQSRAVRWKYICMDMNQNNPQHSEFEIYDNSKSNKEQKFTDAQLQILENGSKAFVIYTDNPINFKELQSQKFKLRTMRGKNAVEWITDLPCASARTMLKTENTSKKEFISEMFIYL
jgi:hypothetical protein